MTTVGAQVGEVPIGTLHESATLEDGTVLEVGDVVGYDAPDPNPYVDPDTEPVIMSEVCTGTLQKIFKTDYGVEVTIENDGYGRIDAEDLQVPAERFDRFRSEIPEGEGCIIERWYAAVLGFAETEEDFEEYEIEIREA